MRQLVTIFLALLGLKFISLLYESYTARPSKPPKASRGKKEFLTEIDKPNDIVTPPDQPIATANPNTSAVVAQAEDEEDLGELECVCDPTSSLFGNLPPPDDEDEPDDDADDYIPDDDESDEENENNDNVLIGDDTGNNGEPIIPIDDASPQVQPADQQPLNIQPAVDISLDKEAPASKAVSKPATNFKREGKVIIASDKDFDKVLEEFDYVFVKFFAPWCPHCQAVSPHFTRAADRLAQAGTNVVLCKVDITVNSKIRKRYNIRALPTVKLFRKGQKPLNYIFAKTTNQMVRWLKKQTAKKVINPKKI